MSGDPLENKYVHLAPTTLDIPGEGLFASRDIPAGTIVATYGGIRVGDQAAHTPYK